MRMREVKGGVPLAAKGVTELKPGSYHVMFMGLKTIERRRKSACNPEIQNAKPQTVELEVKNRT